MAPQDENPLETAAADWLARLQRADVPTDERARFEQWMDESPAHAVAFARAEYAWERAARLRAAPRHWSKLSMRLSPRYWALAAAVAVIAAAGLFAWVAMPEKTLVTGVGEHKSITLADGSRIDLNTASRVEVDFTERRRTVRLVEGEALFDIARDASRPFVVQAGETAIQVLGTEFNVRVRDQLVEVAVAKGLVAVDEVRVPAGGSVIVAPGSLNRVSMNQESVRRRLVWRDGGIELKGETLEQAVEEFNRYRERKLVVADPAIAGMRVGGRFQTDEAEKFLNALEGGFHVRAVESEDGRVYLFGHP